MEPVAYRMGALVAALSAADGGKVYGIMLTASHNPIQDNGVKIIGPDGGILPAQWESVAEEIVQTPLIDLMAILKKHFPSLESREAMPRSRIAVGRDTRPSGKDLVRAVQEGAAILRAEIMDLDLVTTPECHCSVATLNKSELRLGASHLQNKYIEGMTGHFMNLMGAGESKGLRTSFSTQPPVIVDCANGVGALKMTTLMEKLSCRYFELVNCGTLDGDGAILNDGCGADFVKSNHQAPKLPESVQRLPWRHYASLDGDADRLVYFTFDDEKHQFIMLDGDKIAALFALTFKTLLERAELFEDGNISLGIVQTAYANGASTAYLKDQLGLKVHFTSTGVKYLHEAAATLFDIGIYFEANGHGTVLAKPSIREVLLDRMAAQERGLVKDSVGNAARTLLRLLALANPLVGDGLADLLLVEAMLRLMDLDFETWMALYTERPSVLIKIPVKDRTKLVTTDADRCIVEPSGLQDEINAIVEQSGPGGRVFARPSGTEDVVRVYAEAPTSEVAHSLIQQVKELLTKYQI